MKLVKLTFVAALLVSATLAFAINPNSSANKAAAKAELYKNVQANFSKYCYALQLESNTSDKLTIYCHVDKNNYVVIDRLYGDNEVLKTRLTKIMKKNPLKGSSVLIGEPIAFNVKFEVQ